MQMIYENTHATYTTDELTTDKSGLSLLHLVLKIPKTSIAFFATITSSIQIQHKIMELSQLYQYLTGITGMILLDKR